MNNSIALNFLVSNVNARNNGTHISIKSDRACKIRKSAEKEGIQVTKKSSIVMRQGHSYYNQKAVIAKHESGEVQAMTSDELYHKKSELGSAFRTHKKSGQEYLVGQPSVLKNQKATSQFFLNGEVASYEQVEPYLLASEKRKDNVQLDHIMLKVENIVAIKEVEK